MAEIPEYLEDVTHTYKQNSDRQFVSGKLKSLQVYASEYGVSIEGSIPKFIFGNNFQIPGRKTIYQAIEKCNDRLHLNVGKGKLTRLDITYNLHTTHIPKTYFQFFGAARYLKRIEQPESLYYTNQSRLIHIYDKQKQAKRNRENCSRSIQRSKPVTD